MSKKQNEKQNRVSLELRWFFPGNMPENVKSWFQKLDDTNYLMQEDAREDYQLPIPNCDYISVKLREERLEIKLRSQKEPFTALEGKIRGIEEKWTKWAWISDPKSSRFYESFKTEEPFGPTIKIAKARNIRRYQVSNSDVYNYAAHRNPVKQIREGDSGYSIEITNLRTLGKSWWTLAFETIGIEKRDIILMAVEQLLNTYSGPALTEEASYGYPHWLVTMPRNKFNHLRYS